MHPQRNGGVSFWYSDMGGLPARRPSLATNRAADVAIIGGGYTGLWSAYYLKKLDPRLDIVVVEKEFAGFGASGRNGGWLTGSFAWNHEKYLATSSRDSVRSMVRALARTPGEVVAVCRREGINADIVETDELAVATNRAQLERVHKELQSRKAWDVDEDRVSVLDETQTRSRLNVAGALGALCIAGVARIQPAKLVTGLAKCVERLGVTIYESTEVRSFSKGRVVTTSPAGHAITAPKILRCTEGFTATLPGLRRDWLPLNSAQIITEPLPDTTWRDIGWAGNELMGDMANTYCYAQRTRDGRIAMGGRGVPYRFGSAIDSEGKADDETVRRLLATLHRHFPATRTARIDHAWCGVLGVPRDWCATVGWDAETGVGFAGGYVGVGVATSHLAGRTLADLVLGRDTELARLPWVNRKVRKWEPEPVRWVGVNGMYALYAEADRREHEGMERTSRLAEVGNWITGR
ncbi:FAD dependent oxidoreductase [Gonapodya prolifera JEL478]|uniref:FAD dependent oxidoreductase n=1 Tax=Gonapodya prolifera (strain JEL478) TaxID=1344416 RepID=A0A139A8Q1_GONPJ|nr:FAD dependent oxidoreductase [Gonapodya prolifera JEL478]|eukprot:KXS13181.1 FAD dependent oxidoreductase [Gonapodya prolifera JEL478]